MPTILFVFKIICELTKRKHPNSKCVSARERNLWSSLLFITDMLAATGLFAGIEFHSQFEVILRVLPLNNCSSWTMLSRFYFVSTSYLQQIHTSLVLALRPAFFATNTQWIRSIVSTQILSSLLTVSLLFNLFRRYSPNRIGQQLQILKYLSTNSIKRYFAQTERT